MPAILAVETSTLTASVAILKNGKLVANRESGVNSHSELLLPLIDQCLIEANLKLKDLQTIAIGAGPGSFTGLRIGMATVKGLCFASQVNITPVSSLAALAMDALPFTSDDSFIAAIMDARRKEVFVGLYRRQNNNLVKVAEEQVTAPADVSKFITSQTTSSVYLCGDGALKYREHFSTLGTILQKARQTPSATSVARLAQHIKTNSSLAHVAPTYIRLPDAQIKFPDGNTGGTFSASSIKKSNES